MVATPPKTTAPAVPSTAPATPDSKAPSSFEAPRKTPSTAITRPRAGLGVTNGTSVARMNTLTESAALNSSRAAKATAKLRVSPRTMVPTPNRATTVYSLRPMWRMTGRALNPHGDEGGPDPGRGAQPAQADGAHAQALLGDGGQQRHGTPEEHGEQIEGDGPQQHRVGPDDPQALEGLMDPAGGSRLVEGLSGRAGDAGEGLGGGVEQLTGSGFVAQLHEGGGVGIAERTVGRWRAHAEGGRTARRRPRWPTTPCRPRRGAAGDTT